MKRIFILVGVVGLFVTWHRVGADSLWERRDPYFANMFWDRKARRVGDVLTINVVESQNFQGTENRKLEKDTTAQNSTQFNGTATGGASTRSFSTLFGFTGTSTRSRNGTSNYTSTRTLTDGMAVQVVAVLPNGNVVVEGFRTRVMAKENRTIRASGIVRPEDIGVNNTVNSNFIANFTIEYLGKGEESSYMNSGWLGRIFNHAWPY